MHAPAPPITVTTAPRATAIMAIAAHPDDVESWCAGTLALAIDQGALVRLLLVTSGDKGSDDPHVTSEDIARRREAEAQAAAAALGVAEVAFLRFPDGEVEDNTAFRSAIVAAIRRWRPAIIFTHDPEYPDPPYLCHRDHRITGRVALDAVYPLARDHLAFPEQIAEGLMPHAVQAVWLFASATPTTMVDITGGFERKITARLAHASQTKEPHALRERWHERAARIGAAAGISLAETFTVLELR